MLSVPGAGFRPVVYLVAQARIRAALDEILAKIDWPSQGGMLQRRYTGWTSSDKVGMAPSERAPTLNISTRSFLADTMDSQHLPFRAYL